MRSPTIMKQGYENVNGISMYYEMHGNSGEPLVLIHGGGSTIETSFGRILPLLAKHHRVIAVELQAHGHTSDRDGPESFEQDADDVADLLSALKISKASILGYSNGGNTAMQVAIRHPTLVSKLVIASSFYKRNGMIPGFFDGMQHATLDMMPLQLREAFLAIQQDEQKLLNMFHKDKSRMLHFEDWDDNIFQQIKVPVFVIAGDNDVVQNHHTIDMAHLLHARYMILPSSHGGYIGAIESLEDDSDMIAFTAAAITKFLKTASYQDFY